MYNSEEKFGYKTRRRTTVLKARAADAADLCGLYLRLPKHKEARVDEWVKSLNEAADDYYKDVTYIVRDKCNKTIGMIETISPDDENIEIAIWIPDKFKRKEYLDELVESMIEWCDEYEQYQKITELNLIEAITPSGPKIRNLKQNIALSAS